MKYRNIILLLTQRLILKRHEIALRVLYIVRELLVLVVRASMRDNLAHVYCATSRRNQSLILSLVVRNINHVPILKRHGHCVPHTMLAHAIMGIKEETERTWQRYSSFRPSFSIRHLLPVFLSYTTPLIKHSGSPYSRQIFSRQFNDLIAFTIILRAFAIKEYIYYASLSTFFFFVK